MTELLPHLPNISPKLEVMPNMISNPNNWHYYEWLNGTLLEKYLQFPQREFQKPWGIQGYFELPINPIPYNGSPPIGIRVGYARIESQRGTNQNYHSHPYSQEVLFLMLVEGKANFFANGNIYPLPNGPSVVVIPPGIPHDIEVSGILYTMDVKNFDANRIDGLSKGGLGEGNNGHNSNLIRTGPVFIDALSHGVLVVYNPNEESLLELAQMGYNSGWLVSIDTGQRKNFHNAKKIRIDEGINMIGKNQVPIIPALFVADFDLNF